MHDQNARHVNVDDRSAIFSRVDAMKFNLPVVISLLFSVVTLSACNNYELAWSPDGNTLAFNGHDGLRFSDQFGKLSPVVSKADRVVWLPDSKSILTAGTRDVATWQEALRYLTESNQKDAIDLAQYIKREAEIRGTEAMQEDARIKESPPYLVQAALLYLEDKDGPYIRKLLKVKSGPVCTLGVKTISLQRSSVGAGAEEVWHGFGDTYDARISPDGKYAFFIQEQDKKTSSYKIQLISLESRTAPNTVIETAAQHAAWSPDSRSIYFMEALAGREGNKLGSLSSVAVRGEDGAILSTLPVPVKLVYLSMDTACDIRCLKDGRVLFSASDLQLPATDKELTALKNVYSFKPGDQFPRRLMSLSEYQNHRSLEPILVNPDETKAILGKSESLPILTLATGAIEELNTDPGVQPGWRNSDEVCFAKPGKEKQANHHDSEVVLHSMSSGKDRILSENWPESAVDEILIHKKSK